MKKLEKEKVARWIEKLEDYRRTQLTSESKAYIKGQIDAYRSVLNSF